MCCRRVILYVWRSEGVDEGVHVGLNLPFQPIRGTLYKPSELLAGYDLGRADSYAEMVDFLIYRDFIARGGTASGDYFTCMLQSLHDNSMTQGLRLLLSKKKCVATMGGHDLPRNDPSYKQIADLSRILSQAGYLMASGGGPGAMEATHLGALFALSPEKEHTAAIQELSKVHPKLPTGLSKIVDKKGQPNMELVRSANSWFRVAVRIMRSVKQPGCSLGVPTWKYGHEPFTPFATEISKYFQNSIREDGLTSFGSHGIIFAPGKAGTIQEIFQNATNNYYLSFGTFTPMIFLGKEYWASTYPVFAVLGKLFTEDQMRRHVLLTDSIEEAARFIIESRPKKLRAAHPTFALQADVRASS
jgi:predicted Rossmann-fold nucleotide-binding protein